MFDGMPEQFHRFITPTRTSPLPLTHHLPFPLHAPPNNTFTPFDPYNNPSSHHQFQLVHPNSNLLHPLQLHHQHQHQHHSSSTQKHGEDQKEEINSSSSTMAPMNFEIERDQRQQLPELVDPWTNDEVLALLRIRSSMESWFPDLTWEHVSRKMAELGYKRSGEKCKDKFEEESRYFNNNNNSNYGKGSTSYRGFLSELEELYEQNPHPLHQVESSENKVVMEQQEEEVSGDNNVEGSAAGAGKQKETRKRKREREREREGSGGGRFETFKSLCESIVHKMMEQQEEMHKRLIEDMARRDQEKVAREEAWKKQEMERMNVELEMMAKEQAVAGDRHAGIIHFLKKFSPEIQSLLGPPVQDDTSLLATTPPPPPPPNSSSNGVSNPNSSSKVILIPNQHPTSAAASSSSLNKNPSLSPRRQDTTLQVASSSVTITTTTTTTPPPAPAGNNPSSSSLNNNPPIIETNSDGNKANSSREKDDIGRRWPKDEVLALINLRCTSQSSNNNEESNSNNNKAPLWERISQGMMELGYKRSAKRCKEKWENINKYFRKTKDNVNKKRSIDSRTCPYFHQLSNLYSQGKLVLQPPHPHPHERQENGDNQLMNDQTTQLAAEPIQSQVGSGNGGCFSVQVVGGDNHDGGEKTLMQVPSLDFDQF